MSIRKLPLRQQVRHLSVALLFSPLFFVGHVAALMATAIEAGWCHGREMAEQFIRRVGAEE